jgi:hypothetical protein
LTRPLITTRISGAVLSKRGREIAQSLIYDEEYQRRLRIRLMNGSLHPTMEKFLWNLAGHVVVEKLEIDDKREEATRRAELSEMSADQLAERAQNLFLALEKVRAAQADIVDVQPTETPTTDAIDDASGEVQQLPRE